MDSNLKLSVNTVLTLMILTVFSKEIFYVSIANFGIDVFSYILSSGIFILLLGKMKFNTYMLYFYVYIVLMSFYTHFLFSTELKGLIKDAVSILIMYFSMYYILFKNRSSYEKIIKIYVKIAYYTAIFGFFQLAFYYATGIKLLMNPRIVTLDSIAVEPSHYVAIIMPAVIYSIYYFKEDKLRGLLLPTALLLTGAFTGYVVLALVFFVQKINWYNFLFIGVLLFTTSYYVISTNEGFRGRVEGVITALKFSGTYSNHATVVSMFSNIDVMNYSLNKSPLLGAGLGGHSKMYDERFKNDKFRFSRYFEWNKKSAHCMSIRILSEMGFIGFGIYIIFLFKTYIRDSRFKLYSVISIACISHFICKSIKLGGYIDYGTPFFFCLLLLNYQLYKMDKKQRIAN